MAKLILALHGSPIGLVAGAVFGGWWFHALFGTNSHMDASALVGVLFGAPSGALLGAVLCLAAGWVIDRWTGGRLSVNGWKRIGITTVAGVVLGLMLTVWLKNAPWHLIGAWLGRLSVADGMLESKDGAVQATFLAPLSLDGCHP